MENPDTDRPSDDGLPVVIDLDEEALASDVIAHVESVLGWQVVVDGPHLPARLRLADRPDGRLPTVVITRSLGQGDVRSAIDDGALDILRWPEDAGRLPDLVPRRPHQRPAGTVVAVTATTHGVGATTVSLALGALHAWAGWTTVVATTAAGATLASRTADRSGPGEGPVPDLRVTTRRIDDLARATTDAARPDVLVVDRGVGGRGHVLVGRADRALVRAVAEADADVDVIVVGRGAMRPDEVRSLLGSRRLVVLPWSFRVARAGLDGRVPHGLPGTYLRPLASLAAGTS